MILNQLKKLKNVVKVQRVPIKTKKFVNIKEQYFVYFEQPIDWNDSSVGTFVQRVRVGFNNSKNINTIYIGGYADNDWQNLPTTKINNHEVQRKYNANIIQIEYRNYGKSLLNKNKYSAEWCKYLTEENALKDFKFILDQFKTIWKNKWIMSGWSKGGRITNLMAINFPNCCDLFIPYVATAKIKKEDYKLLNFVYKDIGSTCVNKNHNPIDIEKYRKIITFFQIYLLENRNYLISSWKKYAKNKKYIFTKYGKDHFDLIYNSMVVDFCYLYYWQYRLHDEVFDKLKRLLNIKNKTKQLKEVEKYWINTDQISDWVLNAGCSNSYWYQNYTGHGYYSFYPQPLVDNILKYCDKYNSKNIWESLFKYSKKEIKHYNHNLLYNINLTPKQLESVSFKKENMKIWKKYYKTTNCNVIMINGIEDPWYQVSINPKNKWKHSNKIIEYNLLGLSHIARITIADKKIQKEIWKAINACLKKEA